MRFATVCSGIEAPAVAWAPLGWTQAWCSEVDKFCCELLKQRHPSVPNLGDMTAEDFIEKARTHGAIDVLCGGTPCQGFCNGNSGRKGLDDPRSGLAIQFLRLISELRPTWIVWENVVGCLSTNRGRDFRAFISGLVECGYGLFWRVLDAVHFGCSLPRPRIYVVGHRGDWRPAAAVLLESPGTGWDSSTFRKEKPVNAGPVLTRRGAMALDDRTPCVLDAVGARRTTPVEWERALGFKTNYTAITYRNKPAADGPRYKALGNSMAVPVMYWLAERMEGRE